MPAPETNHRQPGEAHSTGQDLARELSDIPTALDLDPDRKTRRDLLKAAADLRQLAVEAPTVVPVGGVPLASLEMPPQEPPNITLPLPGTKQPLDAIQAPEPAPPPPSRVSPEERLIAGAPTTPNAATHAARELLEELPAPLENVPPPMSAETHEQGSWLQRSFRRLRGVRGRRQTTAPAFPELDPADFPPVSAEAAALASAKRRRHLLDTADREVDRQEIQILGEQFEQAYRAGAEARREGLAELTGRIDIIAAKSEKLGAQWAQSQWQEIIKDGVESGFLTYDKKNGLVTSKHTTRIDDPRGFSPEGNTILETVYAEIPRSHDVSLFDRKRNGRQQILAVRAGLFGPVIAQTEEPQYVPPSAPHPTAFEETPANIAKLQPRRDAQPASEDDISRAA